MRISTLHPLPNLQLLYPWNSEKLAWLAISCPWLVWYTWCFCPSRQVCHRIICSQCRSQSTLHYLQGSLAIYPYTNRWWFHCCTCQWLCLGRWKIGSRRISPKFTWKTSSRFDQCYQLTNIIKASKTTFLTLRRLACSLFFIYKLK